MANSNWKSEEDFENDLDLLSDGHMYSHLPKPAPAPSKYMIKLRGKPSIYDDIEDDFNEEPSECIPVRGYPVKRNELKPPGGIPSFLNKETTSMIREVSGFGYSNDLIEHMIKGSSPPLPEKVNKMPNIAFRASNSSANRYLIKVENSEKETGSRGPSPIKSPIKSQIKQTTLRAPTCKLENTMKENRLNIQNRQDFPNLR